MKLKRRKEIFQEIMTECMELSEKKGKDYSGDTDSLSNFKLNAESLGITKYQTWAIYFKKGIDAILNSVKSNPERPQVESEPLRERIKDGIIYLVLLLCLLIEDAEEKTVEPIDRFVNCTCAGQKGETEYKVGAFAKCLKCEKPIF